MWSNEIHIITTVRAFPRFLINRWCCCIFLKIQICDGNKVLNPKWWNKPIVRRSKWVESIRTKTRILIINKTFQLTTDFRSHHSCHTVSYIFESPLNILNIIPDHWFGNERWQKRIRFKEYVIIDVTEVILDHSVHDGQWKKVFPIELIPSMAETILRHIKERGHIKTPIWNIRQQAFTNWKTFLC